MRQLGDLDCKGKRVLIRADLNVPLNENLEITDDNRIKQFLPTLQAVLEKGGRVITPHGERYTADNIRERLSMRSFMEEMRAGGVNTGGPGHRPQAAGAGRGRVGGGRSGPADGGDCRAPTQRAAARGNGPGPHRV